MKDTLEAMLGILMALALLAILVAAGFIHYTTFCR